MFLVFANNNGDTRHHETHSMIYEMDKSTENFSLYQTLPTKGAVDLEYFSISGKHFLAVANHFNGRHLLDSVIYQWNGIFFVEYQKLSTKGANQFTFFTINNEKYLAVANYFDGSSFSIKSVIYRWRKNKFNKFQEIGTEGAVACTAFDIKNHTFLAFANYQNSQQKFSVQSTVFKWSGGHFVKQQSIQTYGAQDVKSFVINGHTFLAFANHQSGGGRNIDSFIYRWDGIIFVLFQSIPTRGAIALHPFVISGQTFLCVANYYDYNQKKYNTQSIVYQASGARFIKYEDISTHGAREMLSFEFKGCTYLVVANYFNEKKRNINSVLYKFV